MGKRAKWLRRRDKLCQEGYHSADDSLEIVGKTWIEGCRYCDERLIFFDLDEELAKLQEKRKKK